MLNKYLIPNGLLRYARNYLKNNFTCPSEVFRLKCDQHFSGTANSFNYVVLQKSVFKFPFKISTVCVNNIKFLRGYAKKKKSSGIPVEESEDEDEGDNEDLSEQNELDEGFKSVTRSVPSLRLDSVLKTAIGTSKKTIEKDFYAGKIRVNGQRAPKKSILVHEGDELDVVKGFHSENENLLVVNRVVVKSIGNVTLAASFPVKLHLFKSLTIENYEDKWP